MASEKKHYEIPKCDLLTCPKCNYTGSVFDDFDNLGASVETNVFCNRCNSEFNPDTGDVGAD